MSPNPARRRRRQYRDDSRRAILDAAEQLLVEGGLDSFSMRRLAERCGCTAPTLYHYFRDKPGLIDSLVEERMQQLVTELSQVPATDDPRDRMRTLSLSFAKFGLRNPRHYELLTLNRGPEAEEPPSGEEARRMLESPLEALARDRGLQQPQVETLRLGLWSLLHGYILLRTARPEEAWSDAVFECSLDALLDSALGPKEAPR